MHKGSLFSTSLPTLVISYLFDTSHSNMYNVISHCGFDLHFPSISDVEHLFICLLAICTSSLENVYSHPLPIFYLDRLFFFAIDLYEFLNIYCILTPYQRNNLQIFSPVL